MNIPREYPDPTPHSLHHRKPGSLPPPKSLPIATHTPARRGSVGTTSPTVRTPLSCSTSCIFSDKRFSIQCDCCTFLIDIFCWFRMFRNPQRAKCDNDLDTLNEDGDLNNICSWLTWLVGYLRQVYIIQLYQLNNFAQQNNIQFA